MPSSEESKSPDWETLESYLSKHDQRLAAERCFHDEVQAGLSEGWKQWLLAAAGGLFMLLLSSMMTTFSAGGTWREMEIKHDAHEVRIRALESAKDKMQSEVNENLRSFQTKLQEIHVDVQVLRAQLGKTESEKGK